MTRVARAESAERIARRRERRRAQRLERREPGLRDEQAELVVHAVPRVDERHAEVGADEQRHAGGAGVPEIIELAAQRASPRRRAPCGR